MKNDRILAPLRQSVRQFDRAAIEFHLERLLKKLNDPAATPHLKVEIHLEVVKALRVINRGVEAARYADAATANIPADSLDILSALKRVRALLHLDEDQLDAALNMIEGCDGLELVLEGGRSVITRSDADVKVETWLVSAEIALTKRDLAAAQDCFNNAVNRLSGDEKTLRHKRIAPLERKLYEQYYDDLGQMVSLFGATLALLQKDRHARSELERLCRRIEDENSRTRPLTGTAYKLPNLPLHSKLLCLLGKWSPTLAAPPPGLTYAEARRWAGFAGGDALDLTAREPVPALSLTAAVPNETRENADLPAGREPVFLPAAAPRVQAEEALDMTAAALERMSHVFEKFGSFLPNVQSYMQNNEAADYSKRGFGGHIRDTDLYNFMQNFAQLRFTGYLRLKWDKDLYKNLIVKGVLPEIVRCGEAYIYVIEGVVTDAAFESQETSTLARARENIILLARLCFSLGVEDISSEILGTAVPDEAVKMRPRQIALRDFDLLCVVSDIESELAGVMDEENPAAAAAAAAQQSNEENPAGNDSVISISQPKLNSVPSQNDFGLPKSYQQVGTASPSPALIAPPREPSDDDADLFDFGCPPSKKPPGLTRTAPISTDDFLEI